MKNKQNLKSDQKLVNFFTKISKPSKNKSNKQTNNSNKKLLLVGTSGISKKRNKRVVSKN